MPHYSADFAHRLLQRSSMAEQPSLSARSSLPPPGIQRAFCWAQLVTYPDSSQQQDQLRLWFFQPFASQLSSITWFATWQVGIVLPSSALSVNSPFDQKASWFSPWAQQKWEQNKSPKHRLFARLVSGLLASWIDLLDHQTNTRASIN